MLLRALGWLVVFGVALGPVDGVRAERVHVPDGTPVQVRLKADLLSSRVSEGDRVDFDVARAVIVRGFVVIPEGSIAWGAVQSRRRDKEVKFNVQRVRLPDLKEIKLRAVRQKTSDPGKDLIRVETRIDDAVGAAQGMEFTAYVDEDAEVEGIAPQGVTSTPARTPPAQSEARAAAMAPAPVSPSLVPASRPLATTSAEAQPTPAAAPGTQPAGAAERVTVECFSDPTGGEILLNGEYYGNTPSILKLLPNSYALEVRLPGYKTFSEVLDLTGSGGLRTIRARLDKRE